MSRCTISSGPDDDANPYTPHNAIGSGDDLYQALEPNEALWWYAKALQGLDAQVGSSDPIALTLWDKIFQTHRDLRAYRMRLPTYEAMYSDFQAVFAAHARTLHQAGHGKLASFYRDIAHHLHGYPKANCGADHGLADPYWACSKCERYAVCDECMADSAIVGGVRGCQARKGAAHTLSSRHLPSALVVRGRAFDEWLEELPWPEDAP